MPTLPTRKTCSSLGCKNVKAKYGGFCLHHGGSNTFLHTKYNRGQHRKDAIQMYQTTQWRKLRQAQLSLEPMCAGCLAGGIVTAADTVDHVFPWQQIGEHSFYRNLYQSLCVSCHTIKTAMEKRGVYRRYGKPSIDYVKGDYAHVIAAAYGS